MFRFARTLLGAVVAATIGLAVLAPSSGATGSRPAVAAGESELAILAVTPQYTENLYTPVAPCRIVDTRIAGGALSDGTQRNFRVRGAANFPGQGGKAGGCGIPAGATAVMATFKSVESSAVGYLRAWSYGGSQPNATTLTYPALAIGDGVAVPLGVSGTYQLSVKAFDASTHLIIDVVGYYAPQIHARVTSSGALDWATGRVLSSSKLGTGVFRVDIDRSLTGCSATAAAVGGSSVFTSVGLTGSVVVVYTWGHDGSPVDAYFFLSVLC